MGAGKGYETLWMDGATVYRKHRQKLFIGGSMGKIRDLSGQRFGKLTAVECTKRDKHGNALWFCVCDCGNETEVIMQSLKDGRTKSCGCYNREKQTNLIHGRSKTRIYSCWCGMKDRCYNTNKKEYKYYGGRGITVCDEWLYDFQAFYEWAVSNGYQDDLTIDRIDVNGNYTPSNCRWSSNIEQANNKRNNRYITYDGQTRTVSELARLYGIKPNTLEVRLRRGWHIEDALKQTKRRKEDER